MSMSNEHRRLRLTLFRFSTAHRWMHWRNFVLFSCVDADNKVRILHFPSKEFSTKRICFWALKLDISSMGCSFPVSLWSSKLSFIYSILILLKLYEARPICITPFMGLASVRYSTEKNWAYRFRSWVNLAGARSLFGNNGSFCIINSVCASLARATHSVVDELVDIGPTIEETASKPRDNFSISAPKWCKAVMVDGVGSRILFFNRISNINEAKWFFYCT